MPREHLEPSDYRTMEDIYDLYARFEEDCLTDSIAYVGMGIPSIQDHFERTFRLLSFPQFCAKLSRMSESRRRCLRERWEMGYHRWFALETRRNLQQMQRDLASPKVRQYIQGLLKQSKDSPEGNETET